MLVKFDSLNRYETPKFRLCNPGSVYGENNVPTRILGYLADTSDEEFVFNFNAASELNLRVTFVPREDPDDTAHLFYMYRNIQNKRLLFVDDIGYFVITGVDDAYNEDGTQSKDIRAQSCEIELQNRKLPYIDGTYKFSTGNSSFPGLIETLTAAAPLWIIGHIDSAVAERYRTFEEVDETKSILAFLLEDVQEAYECIVLFDIVKREINIYDQSNYVNLTDIHITKQDLINSLNITENSEELYTALSVFGNDDLTINAVNPIGGNVIYNFDHYIDWMTPSLGDKVREWQNKVSSAKEQYTAYNVEYYNHINDANAYEFEIKRLESQITMYQRCRNNIIAESIASESTLVDGYNAELVKIGGTAIQVYPEIANTIAEIDTFISSCQTQIDTLSSDLQRKQDQINASLAEINIINSELSFSETFSQAEIDELSSYIYEGVYTDEYISVTDSMTSEEKIEQMQVLYNRASNRLGKVSAPTQEFSIDVENFLFDKAFSHWHDQINTGCVISVELDTNDIAQLFLSNITLNYDDRTLSLTFGNRYNRFDIKSLYDDVLGSINKSANTLDYIKDIIYPIKNGELNHVKEALQTSRNITMGSALASEDEEVIIDGSGYTGRIKNKDGSYDPRQVKLTGKSLVFTNDAWNSSQVAIGEIVLEDGQVVYGINTKALIGDIIVGNELRILDNNGSDMFKVIEDSIGRRVEIKISDQESKITSLNNQIVGSTERIDQLENKEINEIITTTGYKFGAEGLVINRSDNEISNVINNTGMYVMSPASSTNVGDNDIILSANFDGVNALNLTSRQFLIVGDHCRFENYSKITKDENGEDVVDTKRTACFFIG